MVKVLPRVDWLMDGIRMALTIKNAKIALLDKNLAKFRMAPGVHIM